MPTMVREAWTDQRLDDLVKHMDKEFAKVHADARDLRRDMRQLAGGLNSVKGEVGELREEVGELRGEMKAGFAALNRTLQIAGGLIGAMFIGLMGLIGTQL
jgi:chromosome segregation ATPase